MKFQGINLNFLYALEVLLEEKSVTRAAIRLRISQPGMSAALHKLRRHYSDLLLERKGNTSVHTPRARQLQAPVSRVLSSIRSLNSAKC